MSITGRLANLLHETGAVLVRRKKHYVYRLPNGQNFTCSKTPSDRHADENNLKILRNLAGMKPVKTAPKQRRRKPVRSTPQKKIDLPMMSGPATSNFRRKLLEAGYAAPPARPAQLLKENPKAQRPRGTRPEKPEKPKCFHYPPEVLAEANRILHDQGQAAFNEFLKQHREQAVEYLPVRHTHVKEVSLSTQLTSVELRVKLARERIAELYGDCTATTVKIDDARKQIEACEQRLSDNNQKIGKLKQFISAYDLIIEEEKQVETILNPIERMELRQANLKKPTVVHNRVNNPAMSLEQIIQGSRSLTTRQNGASVSEIFDLLKAQAPALAKTTVYNALQYEFRKHGHTRLTKIGKGAGVRYVAVAAVADAPHLNSSSNSNGQQLAAGA